MQSTTFLCKLHLQTNLQYFTSKIIWIALWDLILAKIKQIEGKQ